MNETVKPIAKDVIVKTKLDSKIKSITHFANKNIEYVIHLTRFYKADDSFSNAINMLLCHLPGFMCNVNTQTQFKSYGNIFDSINVYLSDVLPFYSFVCPYGNCKNVSLNFKAHLEHGKSEHGNACRACGNCYSNLKRYINHVKVCCDSKNKTSFFNANNLLE